MERIVNSLLETDAYKFSMGQGIYHQFSDYKTTWSFHCRNTDVFFTPEMVEEIKYCDLRFSEEELAYLENIRWIKGSYVDFLRLWKPRYADFEFGTDDPCGLTIETRGTWLNTSMYEIPTLAIVNEVYFQMRYDHDELMKSYSERLEDKIAKLKTGEYELGAFSEFGLRRRLCAEAEDLAIKRLAEETFPTSKFVGTSNVYLAKKYGVTPVGTMAHEWIMCVGQGNHKHNPAYSNWYALDAWVKRFERNRPHGHHYHRLLFEGFPIDIFDALQRCPPRQRLAVRVGRQDACALQGSRHRRDAEDASVQRQPGFCAGYGYYEVL